MKPALASKGFMLIFLMTFVAFGYIWILLLVFFESAELTVIYYLWQKFKREEEIRGIRGYAQTFELFSIVDELARIQYEDKTVVTTLAKIEYVD